MLMNPSPLASQPRRKANLLRGCRVESHSHRSKRVVDFSWRGKWSGEAVITIAPNLPFGLFGTLKPAVGWCGFPVGSSAVLTLYASEFSMLHLRWIGLLGLALLLCATQHPSAIAQTTGRSGTQPGQGGVGAAANFGGNGQGESFTIERDASQTVGSTSGSFLSRSNAPGTSGTRFGTVQGFGSLAGGTGGLTSSLIGGTTLGGAIGRGMGQTGGGFGNQRGAQLGTQTPATGSSRPIRFKIRSGFTVPRATMTTVSRRFEQRLSRLPGLAEANDVTVQMEGTTAVLIGSVATDRESELVARLALLEPGIETVRNELLVTGSTTAATLPAPAASVD
jgi:hypothetical protein